MVFMDVIRLGVVNTLRFRVWDVVRLTVRSAPVWVKAMTYPTIWLFAVAGQATQTQSDYPVWKSGTHGTSLLIDAGELHYDSTNSTGNRQNSRASMSDIVNLGG